MAAGDRKRGSVADIAFGSSSVTVAAPTVAEIEALTRLECGFTGDGPDTPRSGTSIDISALCDSESRYIKGVIDNQPITGEMFREFDGTDEFYAALDDTVEGDQYLVICRGGFSGTDGAPLAGDIVDVYTVQTTARSPQPPVRDEAQTFTFELAVVQADLGVTVAA